MFYIDSTYKHTQRIHVCMYMIYKHMRHPVNKVFVLLVRLYISIIGLKQIRLNLPGCRSADAPSDHRPRGFLYQGFGAGYHGR